MFYHIFKNRIKCITRDKQTMFWTFLFPILLATLFYMSLTNIASSELFKEIKIAVVDNEEYKENKDFQKVITSVSSSNSSSNETKLFDIKFTTKDEANKLLEDSKIEGYILSDNGLNLIVKKSGMNQTILKGFLDDYKQTTSTFTSIISKDPTALEGLVNDISDRKEYLKEVSESRSAPDTTVNYFYTLIAMACLYGSFLGLKEVMSVQANLSDQAARINLAPTHKLKVFSISMLAAATVQIIQTFLLLLFLTFVLKINFGNQIGYILLTCVVSTLTGVTFGAFVAAIIKKGEGIKTAILISSSMLMSFLAGMMFAEMKIIIAKNIPIINYLNPANLISDAFYSLYYYNTHSQFFTDLLILCGFTLTFSLVTYLILRRQKYASL